MGDTITSHKARFAVFILLVVSILISIALFYPYSKQIVHSFSINYYTYTPQTPVQSQVDTSHMAPAIAVPILMFHGVINKVDSANTTIDHFVADMEMLKREGYQTITVAEYDLFRQGKFILPAKPVIITFDDGRKDSYYSTDDVFKKLGFKATLFEASGPTLDQNSFYLTFDELKTLEASGRWEIEAHGRYSHKKIQSTEVPMSLDDPNIARYLTSRMYLPDEHRLETYDEFKSRVENDYIASIYDLKHYLHINAQYYAIPLNDYGQIDVSNEPRATAFNQEMIQKYFRLAFIQSNNTNHAEVLNGPIYNFKTDDPYRIKRIEVKNMRAEDLKTMLETHAPNAPVLNLDATNFKSTVGVSSVVTGTPAYESDGLHLTSTEAGENAVMTFGNNYWEDYKVEATMTREKGRSVVLLFHYIDEDNYLAFGVTDNSYFLRSTVNGKTSELLSPVEKTKISNTPQIFVVSIKDGKATGSVNGQQLFSQVTLPVLHGSLGFKVWGDDVSEGILSSLTVNP